MEKKVYQTPEVTKVEFDAGDRITASVCNFSPMYHEVDDSNCMD